MRKIMMTIAGSTVLCGTALLASASELAPPAQAPSQAPVQSPKQAPMQAPTPKQAPAQAPVQKNVQAPCQSPVQKGGKQAVNETPNDRSLAMNRSMLRRVR